VSDELVNHFGSWNMDRSANDTYKWEYRPFTLESVVHLLLVRVRRLELQLAEANERSEP
jgi:hypothetical protein